MEQEIGTREQGSGIIFKKSINILGLFKKDNKQSRAI